MEEDGQPPTELEISWQCSRWKALPEAGGVLDQDYRLMRVMTTLRSFYDVLTKLRSLFGPAIHTLSDNERILIRWLIDEKMIGG